MNRKDSTFLEESIVIAIIVIFVAIVVLFARTAMPHFLQSRKNSAMNACIANMKQLEGAREQALLANNTNPALAALCGATVYVKVPLNSATNTVHAVPGPVAPPMPFDCPSPAVVGDTVFVHSVYK